MFLSFGTRKILHLTACNTTVTCLSKVISIQKKNNRTYVRDVFVSCWVHVQYLWKLKICRTILQIRIWWHHARASSSLMSRFSPLFTHPSITFSNQRFRNCSPIVYVGFVKLTSDRFCGNRVFRMNMQFRCHICCRRSVIFRNNPSQYTTILSASVDFHPLFLFADVVFPWFVYADITLETVALDTPSRVAVSVTDAIAKRLPTICPLSKSNKSPIFRTFHTDCHSTQSLMHLHEQYRV
jgi:hypothetical protein